MKLRITLALILVFLCANLAINSCSDEPNELPTATFHLPLEKTSYFVGEIVNIEIRAYDPDGTIAQVEILLNGISIAILDSKPYKFSYEIKYVLPGDYNLELIATDDQGGQRSVERVINVLPELEEFTDTRDGNVYRYVTIGNQTWMADNLAFLPEVSPVTEGSDSSPYYYVLDYQGNEVSTAKQTEEYSKFGVLYNLEAAKQASPEGWHLPTKSEWQELLDNIPDLYDDYDDCKMGSFLISTSEGGSNYYGFSASYAGIRNSGKHTLFGNERFTNPSFDHGCSWWSSSETIAISISNCDMSDEYPDYGLSLRCIKV